MSSPHLPLTVTFDSSVTGQPSWFKPAVQDVANYLSSLIYLTTPIDITVGWGKVNGTALGGGALGESQYFLDPYTYAQVKTLLLSNAKSANAISAYNTLPATDPTGGGTFWLTLGQEIAFGQSTQAGDGTWGWVGFASNPALWWPWSNCNTGVYDFRAVVFHELTECLGRIIIAGTELGGTTDYGILDLFRWKSSGTRQLGVPGSSPSYFSIDGGATNLRGFYTSTNGDPGDWAGSPGSDACDAFGSTGVQLFPVSSVDRTLLDIIGYTALPSIRTAGWRPQTYEGDFAEKPTYPPQYTVLGSSGIERRPWGNFNKPIGGSKTYVKTFERLGPTGGPCTPVGGRV